MANRFTLMLLLVLTITAMLAAKQSLASVPRFVLCNAGGGVVAFYADTCDADALVGPMPLTARAGKQRLEWVACARNPQCSLRNIAWALGNPPRIPWKPIVVSSEAGSVVETLRAVQDRTQIAELAWRLKRAAAEAGPTAQSGLVQAVCTSAIIGSVEAHDASSPGAFPVRSRCALPPEPEPTMENLVRGAQEGRAFAWVADEANGAASLARMALFPILATDADLAGVGKEPRREVPLVTIEAIPRAEAPTVAMGSASQAPPPPSAGAAATPGAPPEAADAGGAAVIGESTSGFALGFFIGVLALCSVLGAERLLRWQRERLTMSQAAAVSEPKVEVAPEREIVASGAPPPKCIGRQATPQEAAAFSAAENLALTACDLLEAWGAISREYVSEVARTLAARPALRQDYQLSFDTLRTSCTDDVLMLRWMAGATLPYAAAGGVSRSLSSMHFSDADQASPDARRILVAWVQKRIPNLQSLIEALPRELGACSSNGSEQDLHRAILTAGAGLKRRCGFSEGECNVTSVAAVADLFHVQLGQALAALELDYVPVRLFEAWESSVAQRVVDPELVYDATADFSTEQGVGAGAERIAVRVLQMVVRENGRWSGAVKTVRVQAERNQG